MCLIRPCHTAAILSRETKKVLFYHAKPLPHGFDCEAWRGKTKLFWSPGTIWSPCDLGECSTEERHLILSSKHFELITFLDFIFLFLNHVNNNVCCYVPINSQYTPLTKRARGSYEVEITNRVFSLRFICA